MSCEVIKTHWNLVSSRFLQKEIELKLIFTCDLWEYEQRGSAEIWTCQSYILRSVFHRFKIQWCESTLIPYSTRWSNFVSYSFSLNRELLCLDLKGRIASVVTIISDAHRIDLELAPMPTHYRMQQPIFKILEKEFEMGLVVLPAGSLL